MVPWLAREKGRFKYMQILRKSEGFDGTNVLLPCSRFRLQANICNDPYSPCCVLVCLYARMGLHSYNLLQGKNLQFNRVVKYNNSTGSRAASTYYITLDAKDPGINWVQTFQTRVSEKAYGQLVLTCGFSRPNGETKTNFVGEIKGSDPHRVVDYFFLDDYMPQLPPQNPFQNTKQFYVLKKSEVQDNDWIRLYLELAIATSKRNSSRDPPDLSNLEILEVAIESKQDLVLPSEGLLSACDAVFYIRYKDWCKVKDVDRIALARRICTGCISLVGHIQSSETIITKKGKSLRAASLFRRRLGVCKPWRLSSPRRAQGIPKTVALAAQD